MHIRDGYSAKFRWFEIWNWNLVGRFPCEHFFTTSILNLEFCPPLSLHHNSGIRKAGDGPRRSDMASHTAVSIMNHRWSRRFRWLNVLLEGAGLNFFFFFSVWIIMLTFMAFSRLSSLGCHVISPCQLDTTHTADSSQAAAGRTWCMSEVFCIQGVLFSPARSDSSGVCVLQPRIRHETQSTPCFFFSSSSLVYGV